MSIPMNRESVKSDEEYACVLWLQEAVRHNLVEMWEYEPKTFVLLEGQTYQETIQMKTKEKTVERRLHQEATYTPDFMLSLTESGLRCLYGAFKPSLMAESSRWVPYEQIWIDIKGTYNPYQNDQRFFSLIQKIMYDKHGIWVPKIVPFYKKNGKAKGLFAETFAPESLRWMKRGGLNACGRSCVGIEEFIDGATK